MPQSAGANDRNCALIFSPLGPLRRVDLDLNGDGVIDGSDVQVLSQLIGALANTN